MSVPITSKQAKRLLVGKTISAVDVEDDVDTNGGGRAHHVYRIWFTDGSRLSLSVVELPADYAVVAEYGRQHG